MKNPGLSAAPLLRSFISVLFLLLPLNSGHGQQEAVQTDERRSTDARTTGQDKKQINRSLESFRKLDDHPLFEMRFYGDYVADTPRVSMLKNERQNLSWACSLFVSYDKRGAALYGRNFDWQHNPALLLHTNPSNGYASISMVDISYLGFSRKDDKFKTVEGRQALLNAPMLPFDGMNEHGLTVGMAAVEDAKVPKDPSKPTVGSLQIIRLMLDRTKTVDEALALFKKYNVDAVGGPMIHYLVADASGDSALIELKDGKTNILLGERNWQSATNFYLTGEQQPLQQCPRFNKIHRMMKDNKGGLTVDQSFKLLKNIAQQSTRWSVVYDLTNRSAQVSMSRNFGKRYPFTIRPADQKVEK